jgi:hypothetical protein
VQTGEMADGFKERSESERREIKKTEIEKPKKSKRHRRHVVAPTVACAFAFALLCMQLMPVCAKY